MHLEDCPRYDRRNILICTSSGMCNTCVNKIIEEAASQEHNPITEDQGKELEALLSGH